jgi:hypothetical protein
MRPGSTIEIWEYPISPAFGMVGGFMRTILCVMARWILS